MAKVKVKAEKDTSERWLLTYADLMNLLLIFFIILYAISSVDSQKFDQLASALNQAFGNGSASTVIADGANGVSLIDLPNTAPSPVPPSTLEQQQMNAVKQKVDALIQKEGLQGNVDVTMQERGVVISIREKVLFTSGSADIETNSQKILEGLGKEVLMQIPGKYIRIEGHTDNDPINTPQFPTNWELSSARATNVLRLLVTKSGLDPTKISAVGYGEYAPIVKNDTPEHKAQNRRVDIAILKNVFDKAEASSDTAGGNKQ